VEKKKPPVLVTGGFVVAMCFPARAYVVPGLVRRRRRRRLRRSSAEGPWGPTREAATVRLDTETPLRREIIRHGG